MSIRQLSSRVVYTNAWMTVREDQVERDNGHRGIYSLVQKQDSAIVLAIEDRHIYLVEQYRYSIGARSLEFPQGSLERAGVEAEQIAREELLQETGIEAATFEWLGDIVIAIGYSNQKTSAFLATGLSHVAARPDQEEHDLVLKRVGLSDFERMVRDNTIQDAQTLAAWALFRSKHREA